MSETPSTQTTLVKPPPQPQLNLKDEVFWLRCSYDELAREIFDLTELIGRLAAKIEEWVGVAEE